MGYSVYTSSTIKVERHFLIISNPNQIIQYLLHADYVYVHSLSCDPLGSILSPLTYGKHKHIRCIADIFLRTLRVCATISHVVRLPLP